MQHDVVDHVVLVLGLVEAERAAQVLQVGRLGLAGGVTRLHVHLQGFPEERQEKQVVGAKFVL